MRQGSSADHRTALLLVRQLRDLFWVTRPRAKTLISGVPYVVVNDWNNKTRINVCGVLTKLQFTIELFVRHLILQSDQMDFWLECSG